MKRCVQFIGSLALGGVILRFVGKYVDFGQTAAALRRARPMLAVLGIGLMIAAYLIRATRWRIWERRLTYWEALRLILVGFMGDNVLPLRLGEVLRARHTAAQTGEGSPAAALASVAAERMLDALILGIFGLVAIGFVSLDRRLEFALLGVSLAFAALGVAVGLGILYTGRVRSYIAAANRRFPGHVTAFAQERAAEFLNGIAALGTGPRLFGAILLTVMIWSSEVGFCYFAGRAVWQGMDLPTAVLFLTVVNFASLIPFTIGGLGAIEAVAPLFLISSGVAPNVALAVTLLQHASQYLFTTITGGILYFAGGLHRTLVAIPSAPVVRGPAIEEPPNVIEETRSRLGQLRIAVELTPARRRDIQLSIVIPAYNEQSRLPRTVLEASQWCTGRTLGFELIIADDGSRDATLALGRLFEESDIRIRTIACPHMGKGAAVRMGMLNAKGRFVLFMDADGATPLSELPKLLAAVEQGHDVAIGSRVVQHPGEVEVKTALHRRLIGRTFAFIVNLLAIEGIADTQCGFKMFSREAAAEIFCRQKIAGFAFDVEILYIARRLSMSVAEIPVNWIAQAGSKVNLVTDSIRMLWDISHIRWLHRTFDRNRVESSQRLQGNGNIVGETVLEAGKGWRQC